MLTIKDCFLTANRALYQNTNSSVDCRTYVVNNIIDKAFIAYYLTNYCEVELNLDKDKNFTYTGIILDDNMTVISINENDSIKFSYDNYYITMGYDMCTHHIYIGVCDIKLLFKIDDTDLTRPYNNARVGIPTDNYNTTYYFPAEATADGLIVHRLIPNPTETMIIKGNWKDFDEFLRKQDYEQDSFYTVKNYLNDDNKKEYDKDAIHEICSRLIENSYSGIVVLKSTVEPGTTNMLGDRYNLKFVHNPEFLSTATAFEDFHNQSHIVIGRSKNINDKETKLLLNHKIISG